MLIFTRRMGEAVVIGDNEINLTILGIKGNQVRLGFVGAKEISIHREEIYRRIQLEKHQANSEDKLYIDETIIDQLVTEFRRLPDDASAH